MKKKILVPIMIVVLLIAMATTAYATTKTCTLDASNKLSVKTGSLSGSSLYIAAYNQTFSTNDLIARPQYQVGSEYEAEGYIQLDPGEYYGKPQGHIMNSYLINWRTKLYSLGNDGGAAGVGSISDL